MLGSLNRNARGLTRKMKLCSVTKSFSARTSDFSTIIYTETDEAPMLATYSFLPIAKKILGVAGVDVVKRDISLSGRVLSLFPEKLSADQRIEDELSKLGDIAKTPDANIIKLPNISASVPQLEACIAELRGKGYDIPLYNPNPTTPEEIENKVRYSKVLGSAVNPVLREGNSDRRVAKPVKEYAQNNPHRMSMWNKGSRTHVAHMGKGDFYASEVSTTMKDDADLSIEITGADGNTQVLKESVPITAGTVVDASFMSIKELIAFYESELAEAKKDNLMVSLHLKATMMKVSDPIIFGHMVKTFYKSVFEKHGKTFESLGVNVNNGLGDIYDKIEQLPPAQRREIERDIDACYNDRPWLAMVDSHKGITNLHVPSDVIVDASMPVVIRDTGMWNKDDELEDTKCIIPDRCYAPFYQEVISYVKSTGQFDVTTMGNVPNVGLMAQKAEEYGSHPTTFEIPTTGTIKVINKTTGDVIHQHNVEKGDIWRMASTKDEPIRDWVRLAVQRSRLTGAPAVFWLDENRGHDAQLIGLVKKYLKDHDTSGLDIQILKPVMACRMTMERAKAGLDTISVTGNVLRDYLTDLFPIIELGTSAKMLSIVPLLKGGGLFETGAGGSAPKHVQQFLKEGHLRWDSLGEYLALAVSLEHLGVTTGNDKATKLGEALNNAIGRLLQNRKSPSRKVNELDNRASNFYIGLYWSEFMAEIDPDFKSLAETLKNSRHDIVAELKACQGTAVDVGGYYKVDPVKAEKAMRPSETLNKIIDG
jgi:isocitrate dehydrogenase